jgi:hypothetical protein
MSVHLRSKKHKTEVENPFGQPLSAQDLQEDLGQPGFEAESGFGDSLLHTGRHFIWFFEAEQPATQILSTFANHSPLSLGENFSPAVSFTGKHNA